MKLSLTKKEARDLLVKYHMINTDNQLVGLDGVMKVMDRLLSIQVDPLDVVGTNINLVMQSRVKNYHKDDIECLLYKDRKLIDGWDKMMAVYKTEDYPKLSYVRKYMSEGHRDNILRRFDYDTHHHKDIIIDMLKEGPKYSKDITLGDRLAYGYSTSKASSITLDYLYYKGKIGVKKRKGKQKQFDLLHNLIGDKAFQKSPFQTEEEFAEYYLLRRIKSLGLVSNRSGVHFSGPFIKSKPLRTKYMKKLIEQELIVEVEIEGLKGTYYTPQEALELSNEIIDQASFIAPLDNFIWERDLIEELFDFNYRWEVYTPVSKRKYGYYVLPILYRSSFVGRIEFENYRSKGDLKVKNIWIESNEFSEKYLNGVIAETVKRFERYLGK